MGKRKSSFAVTIKDVAKHTGLSIATVSRVLNQSSYYSEDARQKVNAAVAELGYHPNKIAQGLKVKKTNLIGLIIPDLMNVFYTSLVEATLNLLRQHEIEMILCVNDEDPEKDLRYLKMLADKNVDGIIYTHPARGNNSQHLKTLTQGGMKIVEINRQREQKLLDAVLSDNYQAIRSLVHHLFEKGHKSIGLITGGEETSTGAERIQGFYSTIRDLGMTFSPEFLRIGSFTLKFGEQAMAQLLDLPEQPTVVIAGSNRIAMGVLKVINERRLVIPDDISLATIDEVEWLSAWNPPITTVDIAIDEMARLAIYLLLKKEDEHVRKPITYRLSTKLNERRSVKDLRK